MPFCSDCGNNYPQETKFCPHCGAPNKTLISAKTPVTDNSSNLRQATDVSGGGSYGLNVNNLPNGTTLENGRYTILKKLGEGGFGVVYQASDSFYDGELKALKVIFSENYSDRLVMHKLKTEAKNMIKINHPNIVRLYDIHFEGEIKFLDMEYIDGGDLVGLMMKNPDFKVPEARVWELAIQIAEGMQAIHNVNIIHQDLKPENILLTQKGVVKITDFGISETFRSSKSRIEESDVKGTFVYASPEQLVGKNVGKEADIWSFGVTLYHICTGNLLYTGNLSSDVLLQIKNRDFEKVPEISNKMNALLSKCLKQDYQKRFRNFEEVINFIQEDSVKKSEPIAVEAPVKKEIPVYQERKKDIVQPKQPNIPKEAVEKANKGSSKGCLIAFSLVMLLLLGFIFSPDPEIIFLLIFKVIIIMITTTVGKKKNRAWEGFFLGLFLDVIGLIIILLRKKKE